MMFKAAHEKDESKQRFMDDFKIKRKNIGQGSYGEVKLARDLVNNELVALKIYEKFRMNTKKKRRNVVREIQLLR